MVGGPDFTQIDGSTIAQLAGPVPKLVTSVTGCVGVHGRFDAISGKNGQEIGMFYSVAAEPQGLDHFRDVTDELGCSDWRWGCH